ncbi:MAG: Gfo/Idh/MocA family oxidoreductase [Sphaerochaeta sp.]|nr:Gfo/Idh/MocA family oxidoreductase [Sphaerochaeta sp.]
MTQVAVLGCGTMGQTHAHAYKNIEDVHVVAVCDIRKEKGIPVSELLEADYYSQAEALFSKASFDVLDICLPTYLHKEYALLAMKQGKHVFCEKPIALSLEDAKEMIDCARQYDVYFSVGHVVRFFPPYRQATSLMEAGKIGIPRLIRTSRNQAFPPWSWEHWYQNTEKSGGPEVDLMIHDFDWIIHYFGKVERVYAKNLGEHLPDQRHCLCILRLANGAMAHVEGSWALPKGSEFRTTYEIVGTEGQLCYDSTHDAPIKTEISNDLSHPVHHENPMYGGMNPYEAELRAFYDTVIHGNPLQVTGEQALEALEVALAAVESARTGESVTLGRATK